MASVFSPDRSKADDFQSIVDPTADGAAGSAHHSTDAHQGLRSLGSFESARYTIRMYSTDSGPRYSIYTARDHKELGVLMSADDVARYYPEIQLPGLRFDVPATDSPEGAAARQIMQAGGDAPEFQP